MFSGHTAMLTILNRFVVTYTPESWHLLHNMCAALNGAGMLFGHLLTHTAQIFADLRTYWSMDAIKQASGKAAAGAA